MFRDTTRVYELDKSKLKSIFDKAAKPVETPAESTKFQFQFFHTEPTPTQKPLANGTTKKLTVNIHDSSSEDEEDKSSPTEVEADEPIGNPTFFFFDIDNRLKGTHDLGRFLTTADPRSVFCRWTGDFCANGRSQ